MFERHLYAALIGTSALKDSQSLLGRIWRSIWARSCRAFHGVAVDYKLHGRAARVNFGNPYPMFTRRYPAYNHVQIEAVLAASELAGRPVSVVDVGAAVGDTALLLLESCGQSLRSLTCVEGEMGFFRLLQQNLEGTPATARLALLSDSNRPIPRLERNQHLGTASAVGLQTATATTLDELFTSVDVLKVDTDGYDGQILAGGRRLLAQHPIVLFEWHPLAYMRAGTSDQRPFDILKEFDYAHFLFYDKYGSFSHFWEPNDLTSLDRLRDLCLNSTSLEDWHYDVLCIPGASSHAFLRRTAGMERIAGTRS